MIKLDEETDRLLEKIASAKRLTPKLVREVIPDRDAFVKYLEERGLEEDPAARKILAILDSERRPREAAARTGVLSRIPAPKVASLINHVMPMTGLKRHEVLRVLPEIVTESGQLKPGWPVILRRAFGLRVRKSTSARLKEMRASKEKAAPKKQRAKARRRIP